MKNGVLQKYVLLEQNKELSLVLDCKTRWSSMYEMIERFILLKKCISKALLDLSIEDDMSAAEFSFVNELKCSLEPMKLAIEALCRKDATLLTAEGIFQFLFLELKKRKSSLAKDLLYALRNRIRQRRQHNVVNLMRYLQNPKSLTDHDEYYTDDIDDIPLSSNTKESFLETATTLIRRLFYEDDSNEEESQDENEANELDNNPTNNQNDENLFERLQAHIAHYSTQSTPIQFMTFNDRGRVSQLQTVIKQEMKLLEATEKRPSKLEQLFRALSSIPPTSVEAERAFSAAGLFATKLRSRLGDKSENALSFLRSHYMKKNKAKLMHLLFVRLFFFVLLYSYAQVAHRIIPVFSRDPGIR